MSDSEDESNDEPAEEAVEEIVDELAAAEIAEDASDIDESIEAEAPEEELIEEEIAPEVYVEEYIVKKETTPSGASGTDDIRRTSDVLWPNEYASLISIRASQIAKNNTPMVPVEGLSSEVAMAERELDMKMIPLKIRRPCGKKDGMDVFEEWSPNCDMLCQRNSAK